jgi:signal transduction protein with GAF and PtsI domain
MEMVGKGLSCSSKSEVTGELVYVQTVEDVINLFDEAEGKICLVDDAGTTTLGPILSDLTGILCTTGSGGSHLAIVSREFDLPCIMNIDLDIDDLTKLNGKMGRIATEEDNTGVLYILN